MAARAENRRRTGSLGAVLVFLIVSILAVLLVVALALDGTLLFHYKEQQENKAELIALAALKKVCALDAPNPVVAAQTLAGQLNAAGGYSGNISGTDSAPVIEFGTCDSLGFHGMENPELNCLPGCTACNGVQVEIAASEDSGATAFFSLLFDASTVGARSRALACSDGTGANISLFRL